jgi:hypothetical protein
MEMSFEVTCELKIGVNMISTSSGTKNNDIIVSFAHYQIGAS